MLWTINWWSGTKARGIAWASVVLFKVEQSWFCGSRAAPNFSYSRGGGLIEIDEPNCQKLIYILQNFHGEIYNQTSTLLQFRNSSDTGMFILILILISFLGWKMFPKSVNYITRLFLLIFKTKFAHVIIYVCIYVLIFKKKNWPYSNKCMIQ